MFFVCNDVYKFIEECMIMVNVSVVLMLEKYEVFVLYCVYDKFDVDWLILFISYLGEIGIFYCIIDDVEFLVFIDVVLKICGWVDEELI